MAATSNTSTQSKTQSTVVSASVSKWGVPVGALIGRGSNAPAKGSATAQIPKSSPLSIGIQPNLPVGGWWWQNEPTSITVEADAPGENGSVTTYSLSYYMEHVLPYEWVASWPMQSLEAGAVSIRTFAWYMINNPYNPNIGADVDDTTNTEMFHPYYTSAVAPYASTIASAFTNTSGDIVLQWVPNGAGNAYQMGGFYKAGTYGPNRDRSSYNFYNNAYQNGEDYWANNGQGYSYMLSYYYPGTSVASSGGF